MPVDQGVGKPGTRLHPCCGNEFSLSPKFHWHLSTQRYVQNQKYLPYLWHMDKTDATAASSWPQGCGHVNKMSSTMSMLVSFLSLKQTPEAISMKRGKLCFGSISEVSVHIQLAPMPFGLVLAKHHRKLCSVVVVRKQRQRSSVPQSPIKNMSQHPEQHSRHHLLKASAPSRNSVALGPNLQWMELSGRVKIQTRAVGLSC